MQGRSGLTSLGALGAYAVGTPAASTTSRPAAENAVNATATTQPPKPVQIIDVDKEEPEKEKTTWQTLLTSTGAVEDDGVSVHELLERRLPPPPTVAPESNLQKRIAAAVNAKQSIVAKLRANTAFKNPEVLGQLVQLVELDERGSNFPTHLYDPSVRCPDFVQLAESQNTYLERYQQQQQQLQLQQQQQQLDLGAPQPLKKAKK